MPDMESPVILFGDSGHSHNLIRNKIILQYKKKYSDDDLLNMFSENEHYIIFDDGIIRNWIMHNEQSGRVYFIKDPKNETATYAIIAYWSVCYDEDGGNEAVTSNNIREFTNELINEYPIIKGNKTGKEMPVAQWRALRYVDENKKKNMNKRIFLTEKQIKKISEAYSMKDKLSLVNDKNVVDGGNFPIKRNGKVYWVSRSTCVGVYVYCQDKDGVVYTLASKRGEHVHCQRNLWNAPCGYLDYGESIKEAAVRECFEETGVKIPINKLVYLGENSAHSRNSDVKHTFYCILDGNIEQYPTSMSNCEAGEVTAVDWIPLEKLGSLKFVGHQASNLYNIGKKLFEGRTRLSNDEDYTSVIDKLKSMEKKGLISKEQIERIINNFNL